MAISVIHALENMRHTLGGGEISVELDKRGILNQAGEYLINMHPWRWSVGRSALMDLRGFVTGLTATWTEATLTLTSTGSFADYTLVPGDQLEINAGTGVTTGFYTIVTNPDDDTITADASISSANVNLATGDIDFKVHTDSTALPDDFRDILSISATDSLLYGVRLTSLEQILQNRTSQIEVTTSWNYQGAVAYAGTPPTPILEIWPSPTANQPGVFTIFYRSGWTRLAGDSVNVRIPEFLDSLYLRLVRLFARGYEREDAFPIEEALFRLRSSPEFLDAARRDGMTQPYYGRLRGGGSATHSRHFGANKYAYIANTIGSPSA